MNTHKTIAMDNDCCSAETTRLASVVIYFLFVCTQNMIKLYRGQRRHMGLADSSLRSYFHHILE